MAVTWAGFWSDMLVYITHVQNALLAGEIAVISSIKIKGRFLPTIQHPNRWREDREDPGECQLSNAALLNL